MEPQGHMIVTSIVCLSDNNTSPRSKEIVMRQWPRSEASAFQADY